MKKSILIIFCIIPYWICAQSHMKLNPISEQFDYYGGGTADSLDGFDTDSLFYRDGKWVGYQDTASNTFDSAVIFNENATINDSLTLNNLNLDNKVDTVLSLDSDIVKKAPVRNFEDITFTQINVDTVYNITRLSLKVDSMYMHISNDSIWCEKPLGTLRKRIDQ